MTWAFYKTLLFNGGYLNFVNQVLFLEQTFIKNIQTKNKPNPPKQYTIGENKMAI